MTQVITKFHSNQMLLINIVKKKSVYIYINYIYNTVKNFRNLLISEKQERVYLMIYLRYPMPLTFNSIFLKHISFRLKDFLVQPVYEDILIGELTQVPADTATRVPI